MVSNLRRISTVLALLLSAAACAPDGGQSRSAQDGSPRIVSLNPCLDAILVEVAGAGQILALSHYSANPISSSIPADVARRYSFTGGTVEEVLALNPDIVLASTFMLPATRAAFDDLGVRVESFGSPVTVDESTAQIRLIGELIGQNENAKRLIRDIDQAQGAPDRPEIETLLWQPGQIVPGEGTLVTELMKRNGMPSKSQAMGLDQADHVSLEKILSDPPELLLIAGRSPGQQHPALQALGSTRVEYLEPRLLYCGGRTIAALQTRLDSIRAELGK